jgi:sec-independent protein translocase protein TatC
MGSSDDRQMTFGEHLEDLRRRLWYCVGGIAAALVVCLYFGTDLLRILQQPILDGMRSAGMKESELKLYATNVVDPFMAYVKVSLIAAAFLASPWVLWHLWQFVATGLYTNERKYVYVLAPASALLFIAGTVFSYFILVRFGVRFLIQFGVDQGYAMIPEVNSNLMLVLLLSLIMGIFFELPLVMLVLAKLRIVGARTFSSKRKLFAVVALVVAAIITPTADAVNLLLATAPMIVLYEAGILLCRFVERGRKDDLAG